MKVSDGFFCNVLLNCVFFGEKNNIVFFFRNYINGNENII